MVWPAKAPARRHSCWGCLAIGSGRRRGAVGREGEAYTLGRESLLYARVHAASLSLRTARRGRPPSSWPGRYCGSQRSFSRTELRLHRTPDFAGYRMRSGAFAHSAAPACRSPAGVARMARCG
eukprot:39096-Chlamydomonas_euryale.AAC.1